MLYDPSDRYHGVTSRKQEPSCATQLVGGGEVEIRTSTVVAKKKTEARYSIASNFLLREEIVFAWNRLKPQLSGDGIIPYPGRKATLFGPRQTKLPNFRKRWHSSNAIPESLGSKNCTKGRLVVPYLLMRPNGVRRFEIAINNLPYHLIAA